MTVEGPDVLVVRSGAISAAGGVTRGRRWRGGHVIQVGSSVYLEHFSVSLVHRGMSFKKVLKGTVGLTYGYKNVPGSSVRDRGSTERVGQGMREGEPEGRGRCDRRNGKEFIGPYEDRVRKRDRPG